MTEEIGYKYKPQEGWMITINLLPIIEGLDTEKEAKKIAGKIADGIENKTTVNQI